MLYEAEVWHPGILDALGDAFRDRWTVHDETLRRLLSLVDLVRREQITLRGEDDPGPIELPPRPGDPPQAKSWVSQMRKLTGGGD